MVEETVHHQGILQATAGLAPDLMRLAAKGDPVGAFPSDSMALLHANRLSTAPLPSRFRGLGLNDPNQRLLLLRVLKHIGRGDLVVGRLFEGHVNALQLIQDFGSATQQEDAAEAAHGGHWFGVWNTQAENGLRMLPVPSAPPTLLGLSAAHAAQEPCVQLAISMEQPRARGMSSRPLQWRLAGSKSFASGAGNVSRPLVTAKRPDGSLQMVMLRTDARWPVVDRNFWQPMGMRCSNSHRVSFDGMPVEDGWLLGDPGDYFRDPGFNGGSVRFAAVQLGGAEALLDETRRFLRAVGHAEDPYQRQRVGQMAVAVETGNLWLAGAAARVDDVPYARLVRTAIEQLGLQVIQLAERCVGARGLMQPEPFERLIRDLSMYLRQAGPDAALALAGEHMLSHAQPVHALWREGLEARPA